MEVMSQLGAEQLSFIAGIAIFALAVWMMTGFKRPARPEEKEAVTDGDENQTG
jgi:hypothetical protein